MPLLRRNSSKEGGSKVTSPKDESREGRSSFFGRLTRSRSRSKSPEYQSHGREELQQQKAPATSRHSVTDAGTSITSQPSPAASRQDGPAFTGSEHTSEESDAETRNVSAAQHASRGPGSRTGQGDSPNVDSTESAKTPEASNLDTPEVQGLSKDDIHHLFSGAPHFMLEKGRRGRYFPQSFFPWNQHLNTTDLQDRRYLKHESFALATLHAHLPIPDEVDWKPGMEAPRPKEGLDIGKRPMFDLGIYERPNMLGLEGREPGTVAMRFFLELPVADGLEDEKKEHAAVSTPDMTHLAAAEAFKELTIGDGEVKIGKHAPPQDRLQLIKDDPSNWRRVGVRDISMKTLTERFELLAKWRDEVVQAGWRVTVLDKVGCAELHQHLFEKLLYPPHKILDQRDRNGRGDLKDQIEALVKVLTVPGAWLDFSLPMERLRFAQILHDKNARLYETRGLPPGSDRRWALIQLLLSVELVIRLDAALRLGVAMHSPNFNLRSEEIHHFNKLRNLKVDWDLVIARRFLDLCYVKQVEALPPPPEREQARDQNRSGSHFLHGLTHHMSFKGASNVSDECECVLLPRQPKVMADGLVRFAHNIGWPGWEQLQQRLETQYLVSESAREKLLGLSHSNIRQHDFSLEKINLHPISDDGTGGSLALAWISGLVIPGRSTCEILMATLLEYDHAAISKLGTTAYLRSGFVMDQASWWSKACMVARVLSPMEGSKESMGWIFLPGLLPSDSNGNQYPDGWLHVKAAAAPHRHQSHRILDGNKIALDSSPLGTGHGKVHADEFSMIRRNAELDRLSSAFLVKRVQLLLRDADDALGACIQFETMTHAQSAEFKTIKYNLRYDVWFVTGHPCSLPQGHTRFPNTLGQSEQHFQQHQSAEEHLPNHPLHNSYKYQMKSIQDFLESDGPPDSRDGDTAVVWIVDARGDSKKDILVRAWCAQKGMDAIVARSGKQCLSCAIREARAIQIGIVIRVGTDAAVSIN